MPSHNHIPNWPMHKMDAASASTGGGGGGGAGPAPDAKESSVSRTMLYKKITKPLLERQRRARINRCLDELKELMSAALAAEGENLTKLEKADVLELTVRHLHQLHRDGELFGPALSSPSPSSLSPAAGTSSTSPLSDRRRYQGGFLACAQQVASYVMKTPGLEPGLGQRLLAHLARCSQQLSPTSPEAPSLPLPPQMHPSPPATSGGLLLDPAFQFPLASGSSLVGRQPSEYSITAQFQLFSSGTPSRPSDNISISPSSSSTPGTKRPASPTTPLHPPKKRYLHTNNYDDEDVDHDGSPSADDSTSPGAGRFVVESRISTPPSGEARKEAGSHDASASDPMWRPW